MDQFSAHLDRGWDLINRGDLAGAQRSAEKSLELDAESPEAHNLLGYVYAAQGDSDSALEHYRQAIALDDSFVEAMLNAAEVLIHPVHDFESAIDLIDEALEWAEGDDEVTDALLIKFDANMHRGDQDAARKVLATVPPGPFESPRLDFLIGRAHFELGALVDAKSHLSHAIEREPDSAESHYYLGLVLDAEGEHTPATVAFLRCRELDAGAAKPSWSLSAPQFERHVRRVIEQLEEVQRDMLDGALVVVCDQPGAEVVADGVDPRAGVMLDALGDRDGKPAAGRAFVYQRNIERMCSGPSKVDEELLRCLQSEIEATSSGQAPSQPPSQPPE